MLLHVCRSLSLPLRDRLMIQHAAYMPPTSRDKRVSELDVGHLKQHTRADHTSATKGWGGIWPGLFGEADDSIGCWSSANCSYRVTARR